MSALRKKVYLAGLIATDYPESLAWRERVKHPLHCAGFEVVSPLYGKQGVKDSKDGGITSPAVTSKSITIRDRRDVREAGVILCHLETFGSPRPLLGTIAELAWAWDQRTPVIGIAGKANYLMRNHPFMVEFITQYVETEVEAVRFLSRYYGNGSFNNYGGAQ